MFSKTAHNNIQYGTAVLPGCGSGSGILCFLSSESGTEIRDKFFPDPGSNLHFRMSFWVKKNN